MPASRTPKPARQPVASSSKITLDAIPPADVAETLTPGYAYKPRERIALSDEERGRLIHELIGFDPRNLCYDITEAAHQEIYNTGTGLENWLRQVAPGPQYENEIATGLHALETLLESHVDKAFDKFTAWVLRNAFEFSPEVEVVLPWQKNLDFYRGEYVASLPRGQEGLEADLEALRTKVEQARSLSQRLEAAEKKLDRRVEIAKQRKAEVGFVKEVIDSAGLSPLPTHSNQILASLNALHSSLSTLDPSTIPSTISTSSTTAQQIGSGGGTKAWELGRAAYLNWALGKVVSSSATATSTHEATSVGGDGSEDRLESIEREIAAIGPAEGVEIQARSL